MKLFGEQMRERRQLLGLTLRDVAKYLGVSHVYVSEVERSVKRSFAQKHWKRLGRILKVSWETLEKWDEASYCVCCDRKL